MFARFAVIGCLVLGALADQDESTWADTETTTKLWQLISSGDAEALGALIEDDASVAVARAADGRGPLWWAYEAKNEEIIDLLKANGVMEEWTDRDGDTAATVGSSKAGQLTKWAEEKRKKDMEEAAKREAEMAAAAAAAQAAGPDEPDYDDDWD